MSDIATARKQLAQILIQDIDSWAQNSAPTITRKDQALLAARRELAGRDPLPGGSASETFQRIGLPYPAAPKAAGDRVKKILATATAQLGTLENPKGSNITKYTIWYSEIAGKVFKTAPWCAMFVSWVCSEAGYPLPKIESDRGFAYVQAGMNWARRNDRLVNRNEGQPGDIVFFDWEGNGHCDHTGIVESATPGFVTCIEGNTSGDNKGSQSNGNGVYRRRRPVSLVAGFLRL